MSVIFVLLWMIFNHVLDDYVLQSHCLGNLKQKDFWKENAPEKKYRYDYLMALAMHSLSWAFMVMLPIAVHLGFNVDGDFLVIFCANTLIHFVVDDLKANRKQINLVIDQSIHLIQIVWTLFILW